MNVQRIAYLKVSAFCLVLLLLFIFGLAVAFSAPMPAPEHSAKIGKLLLAMNMQEASGIKEGNIPGKNDNGKARGPFQIWENYWKDATQFSGIGGTYADCTNYAYSAKVVIAYWKRYAPKALAAEDLETLARVHNGGPAGARKVSTMFYWHEVRKYLTRF